MVDAGGFSRGVGKAGELETQFLLKGLSKIGYSAVNLATRDFIGGGKYLNDTKKSFDLEFDFIASNVFYKNNDKAFSEPYLIKELKFPPTKGKKSPFDKLKIGVIGFCDPRDPLFQPRQNEMQLYSKDPTLIAPDIMKRLKEKVDIVILLYNGRYATFQALIQAHPDINIAIMGGEYYRVYNSAATIGKTIVVTNQTMGKYSGILTCKLNEKKKIISHVNKQVALSESIADDPELSVLVEDYNKALSTAINTQ